MGSRILGKIIAAIFIIALLDLVYLNWWVVQNQSSKIKDQNLEADRKIEISPTPLASASPTPPPAGIKTVETKTVVEKETQIIVQTAQKEIFVPVGSGTTNSNSYADVAGMEVTIDTGKYGQIDSVFFEASVWVTGGNGRGYAQLKNISDNNPFIESTISSASGTGDVQTSGKIPLPSGNKKYGVRGKTDITEFAVHIDNARIKITLK
ncbi:MAG: hypothetical protein NUV69_03215 [Candidatus Curtissbacteria bacterium]|nr:hypothetical protein [Candidatus Curtissbacteria bacterium]